MRLDILTVLCARGFLFLPAEPGDRTRDRSHQAVHISQSRDAPAIVFHRVSFDLGVVRFR
jgi:hypothetical protein